MADSGVVSVDDSLFQALLQRGKALALEGKELVDYVDRNISQALDRQQRQQEREKEREEREKEREKEREIQEREKEREREKRERERKAGTFGFREGGEAT